MQYLCKTNRGMKTLLASTYMDMAKYILSILKTQLNIVFSWGLHSPMAIKDGLMFKVQGFKHSGWVKVIYNQSADLFDISLLTSTMIPTKEMNGIYFDQLVEVIDDHVEKVEDYKNKVKAEYSLV